jgi:hypothetical protein
VSYLSRFLDAPQAKHYKAVMRVLRYLSGIRSLAVVYRRQTSNGNVLGGYSDASWATCEDTRKSTSGYVLMLNGGPVSWRSHLQSVIALSSTEAEYIAACEATQEET